MNSFIFSFLFSIVMISAFVYVVKNHEMLSKMYEQNKDKKQITLHTFEDFKKHCNIKRI